MSDTHTWDVSITGGDVIATIQTGTWYKGPFTPGELVTLATITIRNDGNTTGDLTGQPFFYPGETNEQPLTKSTKLDIVPGETWRYNPAATIPIDAPPGGILPVGVKVWGETETEPTWSLGAGRLELPSCIVPITIIGCLAVAYLVSR